MKHIPLNNLSVQYQEIKEEADEAIKKVIDSNAFINGPDVSLFEEEFAEYCQAKYCCGVGNGTDALILALKAVGVKRGDYVLTAANTFIATSEAITIVGGIPAFVDIDPDTCLMDIRDLRSKIEGLKEKGLPVRAVIPVHLYGRPCEMSEVIDISREFDLRVIEDSAQAHGAEIGGVRVGGWGDVSAFSFYPGKNLGAFGDAGAVVTNDESLAKHMAMLKNHGRTEKYIHEIEGFNSRLDTIQAAVLRIKLRYLDAWTDRRIEVAKLYNDGLKGADLLLPDFSGPMRHVFHLYVVRTQANKRDRLADFLKKK